MIDYALWEVIENGASFPKTQVMEGVTIVMPITFVEEKAQRRLEVKTRSTLMMRISNERQLKFNSIKDAKQLLEAIEKRFDGNVATKKTQRNLLKQQYENFTASSLEMLDKTFDRFQKLRNKADLDTMSMYDLYNNLKVYDLEVKGMECRAPRNQDNKHKESSRRSVSVETTNFVALLSFNGLGGYDWSDQADEGPNYALMAFTSLASDLKDQGVIDSGYSRNMTGNMSYLIDYKEMDGGYVAFGGNPKVGKITGKEMNRFFEIKGIMRQFSVAKTPQQNRVTERRNMTLIKAARTMLADSKLPTTFKVEVVNTACYVQNKVLVVKPHNKTPYELYHGQTPTLSFMRPFGCPVTILNNINHLSKFEGKADEGFFIGYSLNSKAFRVFNSRTRILEENLHIRFSESTPNVVGSGPDWLFDIDALTRIMNYEPIVAGIQSNGFVGTKASDNACQARKETEPIKDYILLPLWTADPPFSQVLKISHNGGFKPSCDDGKKVDENLSKENECNDQEKEDNVNRNNNVNTISSTVNATGIIKDNELSFDPDMLALEYVNTFNFQVMIKMMKKDRIFISQDKYVAKNLKKFRFTKVKNASTTMETQKPLLKDEDGEEVDVHMYRSMIGSLMCLTSSRPDIMFAVCACARYQVNPNVLHLHAVKRIFSFKLMLLGITYYCWVNVNAVEDGKKIIVTESSIRRDLRLADKEGKDVSSRVKPLFPTMVVQNQAKMGEGSVMPIDPHHTPTILQPSSSQHQKTRQSRKPKRKNTKVPQPSGSTDNVADEAVHKELGDSLVRAATTASSLEAE
nr:ribonuclease H-like domain-containing protein [Tanacetum cinerariifolium]